MSEPLVSVVIPTWRRPQAVVAAVHSALSQSLDEIEVRVVLDGPDEATQQALQAIEDDRLHVSALPEHGGPAAARNAGVAQAKAERVAFLDDDDAWLSQKLERQIDTARRSKAPTPIVATRVLARSESREFVWPRRFPRPGEPIGDYLFCRSSLLFGEGLVPTNTILVPTKLLRQHPFSTDLEDHEDVDWLLRVCATAGATVEFVDQPDPLAVWSLDAEWSRMSDRIDWRWSMAWALERKNVLSDRAYAGFLLTWLGGAAARAQDGGAMWPLLREAFRHGRPRFMDLLCFAGYWCSPRRLQSLVAGLRARHRTDAAFPAPGGPAATEGTGEERHGLPETGP